MSKMTARLESALADRYTIRRELGRGGMAVVYLADDLRHERQVAIKVLRPELASDIAGERFLRETKLVAGLTHPHILPLLDSGKTDGLLYYVMPYVEGETLRGKLDRQRRLSVDEAVRITLEVADALSYAHGRGLLHRDIKPENILLEAGHAVVADFGIARVLSEAGDQRLTETGMHIGTPAYMSPEQAAGERDLSAASDLYSLGCVLYEMLAGKPPVSDTSLQRVMSQKLLGQIEPLRTTRNDVPRQVDDAVTRSLATEPADRFTGADQFIDALSVRAGPGWQKRGVRRWIPWAAATVILAAAIYGVGSRIVSTDVSDPPGNGAPYRERTVAVLPFENISPDPEGVQWFVDAVREEISDHLVEVSRLTVTPTGTARRVYGEGDKALREIASELQVASVLEGSVLVAGDSFRVTVRLIDHEGATTLWHDRYEGGYTTEPDIFVVFDAQADVAKQVASALGAELTTTELARIEEVPTQNQQAWSLYHQGRMQESTATPESVHRAIGLYNQAIDEDSGFGQPYAGKASAYQLLGQVERWTPEDYVARVTAAAELALQIDSTLADPYRILGELKLLTWDFAGAERDFEEALRVDPKAPMAHAIYAQFLTFVGRHDEAIDQILQARDLDAANPFITANVGARYYYARRYDEALAEGLNALELGDQNWVAQLVVGITYAATGVYDQAIERLKLAVEFADGTVEPLLYLAFAYARAGQRSEAEGVLDQLENTEGVAPSYLAIPYAGLGDIDQAFEWLETAYEDRDLFLVWVLSDPMLDSLWSAPRFQAIVKDIGLTEYRTVRQVAG